MTNTRIYLSISVVFLYFTLSLFGFSPAVEYRDKLIDWPKFIAEQDLVWNRLPVDYFDGPFLGNGMFGAIVFKDDKIPNTLRFEIGRSDVYDHRDDGTPLGHARIRLPIGQLLLTPKGRITAVQLHLDLWNAELHGVLTTTEGVLTFRCFVPSAEKLIILQLSSQGNEKEAICTFRPQQGDSQRYLIKRNKEKNLEYKGNPALKIKQIDGYTVAEQTLSAGSDYATTWKEITATSMNKKLWDRTFLVTVANAFGDNPKNAYGSAEEAVKVLKVSSNKSIDEIERVHRTWWHAYYPKSYLLVPDKKLEQFFWVQMYKLGSATRPQGPVIDLMGPWFKPSVWAALWMNLNVQLTYSTLGLTNHLDLEDPLYRMIERHQDQLIQNVPDKFRSDCSAVSNPVGYDEMKGSVFITDDSESKQSMNLIVLPWLMQCFYTYNQRVGDDARLRQTIYPLMRRTFSVYLHILYLGKDGKYHIPLTYSDEYGVAQNTSLNLSLAKWGFSTLISCANRLKIDDPLLPQWKHTVELLSDLPTDPQTGIMIGEGVPFMKSHRHFSHLFAIWPLHTLDLEREPALRPLVEQSISHFTSLEGDNCMFKYTGASSLWATLGNGDEALRWLQRALVLLPRDPSHPVPTVGENTLYSENGWPTFESPIAASRNIIDMLLQDESGKIKVFPAVPSSWKDVVFYNLRAQGGKVVSAERKNGKTVWVSITPAQ